MVWGRLVDVRGQSKLQPWAGGEVVNAFILVSRGQRFGQFFSLYLQWLRCGEFVWKRISERRCILLFACLCACASGESRCVRGKGRVGERRERAAPVYASQKSTIRCDTESSVLPPEHLDKGRKIVAFDGHPPEPGVLETFTHSTTCTGIRGPGALALPAFLFLV